MSKSWYLSTSDDYLSGYENEEFTLNATSAFDEVLNNSPESYDILHNSIPSRMVIQDQDDREKKKVLSKLGTIERGDIISYKGQDWLVTDYVDDNKMYQTAKMHLCNASILISSGEKVPIGWDDFNNPIYGDDEDTAEEIKCIAEKTMVYEGMDNPINLDEDKIKITLSYFPITADEFQLYGENYVIKSIDKTKSINEKGLLILLGQRKV